MKTMDKKEFEQQNIFGTGAANEAFAQYFIGDSFLNPLLLSSSTCRMPRTTA